MLVRDVMTSPAVTASSYTTTREAVRLLAEHGITSLPVIDDDGCVIGIVSEHHILGSMSEATGPARPVVEASRVGEAMTRPAVTVTADSTIADAVAVMTSAAIKSLPVVLHDRIVGVVSRSDLIRYLAHTDVRIRYEVTGHLRATGNDWTVAVDDRVVTISGPVTDDQRRSAEELARTVPGVTSVHCR